MIVLNPPSTLQIYSIPIVAIILLAISAIHSKTKTQKQKSKQKTVQFSNIMDILVFTKAETIAPRRFKVKKIARSSYREFLKSFNDRLRRRFSVDFCNENEILKKSILKCERRKSF